MKHDLNYDLLFESLNSQNALSVGTTLVEAPQTSNSNIHNLLQFTVPDGKLFYPEPFIASPSYLHSDLSYLHIFQY